MKIFCTGPLPLLYYFLSEVFIDMYYYQNFHGERGVQLHFNQSVHGWKYHPSKTMMICAPLLFFSPVTSVQRLHMTFVDRVVSRVRWNAFVTNLSSQLEDSNLLVSLLTSSFLFIPVISDTLYNRLRFF